MQVGVVIPIVNDTYIYQLLDCIGRNSTQPDLIIIIDNSKNKCNLELNNSGLRTEIYQPTIPLNVNASWNYGIHALTALAGFDLISILNDDLLLEDLFFEKMIRLAKKHQNHSVFCPETVKDPNLIRESLPLGSESGMEMSRREGWAWTIRSSAAKYIPPIPEELVTFCGDDWFWYYCKIKLNRPWLKMINNRCFHYVGVSKLKNEASVLALKKERALFQQKLQLGLPPRL